MGTSFGRSEEVEEAGSEDIGYRIYLNRTGYQLSSDIGSPYPPASKVSYDSHLCPCYMISVDRHYVRSELH